MLWTITLLWFVPFIVAPLLAQVTNTPPVNPLPGMPEGKEAIWLTLVAPITFMVTWLVGKIPPLPKVILPWITPVVGILLGQVMKWATDSHWAWWSSAAFGAIATTIYEAAKGVSNAGPASPLTPTPEPPKP